MDTENFLAIYDVLLDVQKELNVAAEPPTIRLMPRIIRFSELFPGDSIGMRDRYCELRAKAVQFLQRNSVIQAVDPIEGYHRWDTQLAIKADRSTVEQTLSLMTQEYKHRTSARSTSRAGAKIFIGHGGSTVWKELKDFLAERLHLEWDEFNRE